MAVVNLLLGLWTLNSIFVTVWADGCNITAASNFPGVNMCGQSDVTMGRALISVTSATMGSNTWCRCTLRSRTSGLQTSSFLQLYSNDSHVDKCHLSLIQIDPVQVMSASDRRNFTCTTPTGLSLMTGSTTSNVTVTLTRPETSVGVSYCLLLQPDRYSENDMVLSCQSGTSTTIPAASSTHLTTTTNTESTTSLTTPPSTSPTSASLMTSSVLATSSSSSPVSQATVTDKESVNTSSATTMGSDNSTPRGQDFPVAAVAGGVSGAIVLLVVIVVIVVVCKRRQGTSKTSRPGVENAHANPEYSADEPGPSTTRRPHLKTSSVAETPSSSQNRSQDGLPPASINPYELEDETAQDEGAVSLHPAAGSAMMKLDTNGSQPPNPAANLYAVVNKSKGRQVQKPLPETSPKPGTPPTSASGSDVRAVGDEYAVVDKARKRGANAKQKSDLPSSQVTPPPVPPSPGLLYADLEEVRGEGRRPAPPRPPANMATETEYAEIDHKATARFSTEA